MPLELVKDMKPDEGETEKRVAREMVVTPAGEYEVDEEEEA